MRLGAALAALAPLLLAAGTDPPREAEGGYWQAGGREGHYRARVVSDRQPLAVQIEWIAHASSAASEAAVASETVPDLAPSGGPWRISNPELRVEGTATLLTLDAREEGTGSRRQLVIELGAGFRCLPRARPA